MNKLFSKIATLSVGLTMAVGVGVALGHQSVREAKADDQVFYSLDGTVTGGTNSYATESEITQGEKKWMVMGNTTTNPWRIGGNSITNTNRPVYSTESFSETVTKIGMTVGTASSITVNSLTLTVSKDENYSSTYDTVSGSFAANSTFYFEPSSGKTWEGCYFKFVFNVTVSGSSNKFVQLKSINLYKQSSATLQSIHLEKDDSAKVEYVDGDSVSFAGIKAVGVYSDSSEADLTSSCTISADRAKVATGETSITYSAVYNPGGFTIADFDLSISVVDLAISKVESNGNYRVDFVEKQKFSYGTGKVKVTWNNGTSQTLNPTAEGVTAHIGSVDITGKTHYMTMDDNGQTLTMSYGGKSFDVGTITVTEYEEPEAGYWSPITSLSELSADMKVIIVASGHEFAMGKYSTGNNVSAIDISKDSELKISSSIPGVQVYTLVESTAVEGAYSFYDGSQYLAATGGTSSNYLKAESSISANSSFVISLVDGMKIVGQGSTASGARMTMRYNPGDIIFSCYGATSTTGSLACLYKFTKQEKSADQIAVENFVKVSLHLDENDPGYIDPNDESHGSACKGETGYYAEAKEAYGDLTEAQQEIFLTSADVLIMWGRARFTAWAAANGEIFNSDGTFSSSAYLPAFADNNSYIIIIVISAVSVMSFGLALFLRKKRSK